MMPKRRLHTPSLPVWAHILTFSAALSVAVPAHAEKAVAAPTPTPAKADAASNPAPTKADAQPALASEPNEEQVREAGEHYDRGLKLYSEGDYSLAVIEFDRAHALVPDFRVLYNIGQVRIQLGNYADARRALEQYIAQGGERVPPDRRKSVAADLNMLSARTATLSIQINVPGAEITIDDSVVGSSPLTEPLLLDAGAHRLSARKDGYSPEASRLTLAGGDAASARFDLKIQKPVGGSIIVEKQVEKSYRSTWLLATWSATAVFAAGAGVTGGLGLSAANTLDNLRTDPTANRSKLDSQERRARTLLAVADVLGGAAIVTGSVALIITLSGHSRPASETPKPGQPSRNRVSLAVGPRWVGITGSY